MREKAGGQPAGAADTAVEGDVQAPRVVAVRGEGDEEGADVADDPGRDGKELGRDGCVAETGDDRGGEECEGAQGDAVEDLALQSVPKHGWDRQGWGTQGKKGGEHT